MRVVALLASHNRRERTLECLNSYFAQGVADRVDLEAILVDDGSTDATGDAVRRRFERVTVVEGTGSLYWAGAMAIAEGRAAERAPDALLWLNDDVVLDTTALETLIDTASPFDGRCIVVGAVRDPDTDEVSYSGLNRLGSHPLRVELVRPANVPTPVDTFNGNVVFIPAPAHDAVGSIDGAFVHDAADLDYGLRAANAGVPRLLTAGTVGVCRANRRPAPWADPAISRRQRLRELVGPKGMPPRERARFLRRHGGRTWPLLWLRSYAGALAAALGNGQAVPRP